MRLEVYQDILSEHHRDQFYMYAVSANYKIGWEDSATFENRQYPCLHNEIEREEWENLQFIEGVQNPLLRSELSKLSFQEAVINLVTPASIQFPHTHGSSVVLTYYINPVWQPEYYGETIFYDQLKKESIKTVSYKPNAGVLFDGLIPHSIRPASFIAPSYRFTLSVFYKQPNFIEEVKNST